MFFCTGAEEKQSDMPQPSQEAVSNKEATLAPATIPLAQQENITKNRRRDVEDPLEGRCLGDEDMSPVK